MSPTKKKKYKSILGIGLDDGLIYAILMRRNDSGARVEKSIRKKLALDPLTHESELVGREILNLLEEAGIRENRCVVCVPLKWVLTQQIELPQLSDEDRKNYIQLQAERGFPFSPDDLSLSMSCFQIPNGRQNATLAAIPTHQLRHLTNALKAAKLRPISITVGITALQDGRSDGKVVLQVCESGTDLCVMAGGGIVAIRRLQSGIRGELYENNFDVDSVIREVRITLGQLNSDLRNTIHDLHVLAPNDWKREICDGLRPAIERMGLSLSAGSDTLRIPSISWNGIQDESLPFQAALARFLTDNASVLEFLPPQVNPLKQLVMRMSSRGNLWIGASAVLAACFIIAMFIYQHVKLTRLETRWSQMEIKVAEIETIQQKVKNFRPWFDESVPGLSILRTLTQTFPEEGTVWVKMVEIRDLSRVSCSGFARNNRDWLTMFNLLQEDPQVFDLRVQQTQGETPMQFSLNFMWKEGAFDESQAG